MPDDGGLGIRWGMLQLTRGSVVGTLGVRFRERGERRTGRGGGGAGQSVQVEKCAGVVCSGLYLRMGWCGRLAWG